MRHIGVRQIHFDVTDSTNNRAAELAHDLANSGTVITTDLQSQGRGQHGRVWQSPAGTNVLLSTLLFPPPKLQRPAILTAFAAVAVAETILQAVGKQATIKWPNDVLVDGKKVCGILIEGGTRSVAHFIVGIGLNVNQSAADFEQVDLAGATSLSIIGGRRLDVRPITELLVQNLDEHYQRLLNGEVSALEECWNWRIAKVGRPVTVELTDANLVQGQLQSLTFDALELALPNGEVRRLRPEEVRHLR